MLDKTSMEGGVNAFCEEIHLTDALSMDLYEVV